MKSLQVCILALLLSGCLFAGGGNGGNAPDTGAETGPSADADAPDAGPSADATISSDAQVSTDAGGEIPTDIARTRDGLVVYYPFRDDPDGQALDHSGGPIARNLDLPTTVVQSDDGLTGEIAVPIPFGESLVAALATSGAFTAEVWVRGDGPATPILTLGEFSVDLRLDADEADDGVAVDGVPLRPAVRNTIASDRLTHLVVTGADDSVRVYSDGVLVAGWIVDIAAMFPAGSTEARIGGIDPGFDLGLLAVYDRALSPGEILAHNLVGPRPQEADETDTPLDSAVATWAESGLAADSAVLYRTIGADFPDVNWDDRVVAGTMLRGLVRLESATPPGEVLAARLSGAFSGNNDISGAVHIWAVPRPWRGDVSWRAAVPGTPWEVDGAQGEADRGASPIHVSPSLATGEPYRFDVDITDLARQWSVDPRSNHGFLFTCDFCQLYLDFTASIDDANRPRVRILSSAPRAGAPPGPPQLTGIEIAGTTLDVAWNPFDGVVEFYVNGRLRERRSGANARLALGASTDTVDLVAVDDWGRASPPVRVHPGE